MTLQLFFFYTERIIQSQVCLPFDVKLTELVEADLVTEDEEETMVEEEDGSGRLITITQCYSNDGVEWYSPLIIS